MTVDRLIWCSTRKATVGLVVRDGVVVDCPPYARRWALGKNAETVVQEQQKVGADVEWAPERWPVVAATGHRPQDLAPAVQDWCRIKLTRAAVWLRDERGCRVGISGMALGVDQWWAQAVLDAGLELHAYVPFPEQPDVWPVSARAEWRRLLDRAARVVTVGSLDGVTGPARKGAAVRLLHARNDAMLNDATALLAVLDLNRTSGGTWSAVRKATLRRMPGVHVDPYTSLVRIGLPDLRKAA